MRLINAWLIRRRKNKFLRILKDRQDSSQSVLGVSPFFVSAFDSDARSIIEEGIPSYESISILLDEVHCRHQETIVNEIAIDVGANYGTYSILFSRYFKSVIAYEAHPVTFKILEQNLGQLPNIQVNPYAISSSTGQGLIHEYRKNHSGSASLENLHWVAENPLKSSQVQKSTLDIQLGAITSKIGLIKIDVEGHELEVLKGSRQILSSQKPAIIFENNTGEKAVLNFLQDFGYDTFLVSSADLVKRFTNKRQLLLFLMKCRNPIGIFWKLYSGNYLMELPIDSLQKCELVLTFHNDKSPQSIP
jgi:FkbM family methyltransferase